MDLFSLAYVSTASGVYNRNAYGEIARTSQHFNSANGITGMLLVYNETILQFLEGPEDPVRQLYARIEQDPRHKNPFVVSTRTIDAREFPNWSMGYQDLPMKSDPEFLFRLNPNTMAMHFPYLISDTTAALLNSFKRSSGLVKV